MQEDNYNHDGKKSSLFSLYRELKKEPVFEDLESWLSDLLEIEPAENAPESLLWDLVERFNAKAVFWLAFAAGIVRLYQEAKFREVLLRLREFNHGLHLARVFFIILSLDSLRQLDNEGRFISVRTLAGMLNLKKFAVNRALNFLCLLGLVEKAERGEGKAYSYTVKLVRPDRLEKFKTLEWPGLNRERAAANFGEDKAAAVYLRKAIPARRVIRRKPGPRPAKRPPIGEGEFLSELNRILAQLESRRKA